MPISPCNNLNVKTIRVSQLASNSALTGDDLFLISQFDSINNIYYSKRVTLSDLSDYFGTGNFSYSGSFSGSFYGKLVSKNTKASGSLSGSFYGKILSKNTNASGSFSGSILSKNTNASGSFSGSFYGQHIGKNAKLSGSFSGSHYGQIISKNAIASGSFSGSFYGQNIGKNAKLSGSFYGSLSGTATTASYVKTSSYLRQDINTTSTIPYFNGTRLVTAPGLLYGDDGGTYRYIQLTSSRPVNSIEITSKGASGLCQSRLILVNQNRNISRPKSDAWTVMCATTGSLSLSLPSGSYQLVNSGLNSKSDNQEVTALVSRRNNLYFWPYASTETAARDGAVGIGVFAPIEPTGSYDKYLRAKLQINMFSGSNEGHWNPPATGVEHRAAAILVNYGSGSLTKTFYVSASGNTYIGGNLTVDKAITSSLIPNGNGTSLPVNVKYIPIQVGGTVYKLPLYT